jgi:hypothetical protein
MIIELTESERFIERTKDNYWMDQGHTLAWRAFGKAIGVPVHDPMMVMDGDGSQVELITRRWFYLDEAKGNRYLSLGHFGCWDEGAMRSLSPSITYISYNAHPDWPCVEFHGWYIPKEPSCIIIPKPVGDGPFLMKDQLFSMDSLIATMRLQIAQAEQAEG